MWKGRFAELRDEFNAFFDARIITNELKYYEQLAANRASGNPWQLVPIVTALKEEAKGKNLFNLFLPAVSGLTQYEYAQLAETMGRQPWAVEVFNCDAPDTGNMETLHLYGTDVQKKQWLEPLLSGEIRSAFCMTEKGVASSDATNIATRAVLSADGKTYTINGRKWWTSGFGHPNCKILIVMVKTAGDSETNRHKQQSMILVPRDTPGIKAIRPLHVFGSDDAPHGHFEVAFENVVVPASNILLGEGRGFEIAQGRLGPGRIHHCMRSIGMAERALELMVLRAAERKTFGKRLLQHGMVQEKIAESRVEIDQARLLVLHAADTIDKFGTKRAFQLIAMIKVAAPRAACNAIDRAIQVFGGAGVSQDTVLPMLYIGQRSLRIADGPDEVHLMTIAKVEAKKQLQRVAASSQSSKLSKL